MAPNVHWNDGLGGIELLQTSFGRGTTLAEYQCKGRRCDE